MKLRESELLARVQRGGAYSHSRLNLLLRIWGREKSFDGLGGFRCNRS